MRPALFVQRSDAKQLTNLGASEAMSLSFPVLSTSVEDKFSKFSDAIEVCSRGEMMTNPNSRQASALISGGGTGGQLFSAPSRFPNDIHLSSISPSERRSQNSTVISQANDEKPLPSTHASHSETQFTTLINHTEENKDIPWCPDSIQDFLDFSEIESVQNGPMESSTGVITYGEHVEKTDWQDWDQFPIHDALEQYWSELPVDDNVADCKPKVVKQSSDTLVQHPQSHLQPQAHQHQPVQSAEFSPVPDPLSIASSNKPRMRWTQELHESFVEAVNKLGGSERATPKGILNLMKVEGLTIYHVKSHLQKYRTARYKPESPEGNSEGKSTPTDDMKSLDEKTSMGISEALRLQVELQKCLHEQLENQRKLQLQIEEQGKCLEKMFEQRRKASTSTLDDPHALLSNVARPSSSVNDKSESSKQDHSKTSNVNNASQENSQGDASLKQKALETKPCEKPGPSDGETTSPPPKRARSG
ncbi:hypothetical protein FNV43_RR02798 [Rhamnella rubrinervis]|uniref:HTH myb-type domain-containing protein n=1 Tax=Rhamnella rubrinervis TaxID=2594499 RepID=A0A8K0HH94_9ROSA|nr:hypothetical protein FNV43_RR02798 [Rhamnella rubrinervis]